MSARHPEAAACAGLYNKKPERNLSRPGLRRLCRLSAPPDGSGRRKVFISKPPFSTKFGPACAPVLNNGARLCGLLGFPFRSKSDSRLLLGGGLGCDGSVGFERRGVGADGSADHWST